MDLCATEPLTGFELRSRREPSLHPTEEPRTFIFGGERKSKLAGRRVRCVVVSDGARTLDRTPTNRLAQKYCGGGDLPVLRASWRSPPPAMSQSTRRANVMAPRRHSPNLLSPSVYR